MDPSSPEAHAILRHYNVPYDEVISFQFHHQVGKYVSGVALTDKIQEWASTESPFYVVAPRRCNCDAMGSYYDIVSTPDPYLPLKWMNFIVLIHLLVLVDFGCSPYRPLP